MKKTLLALTSAMMVAGATAPAFAQSDFTAQLKARQGQFRILAINLGILGGMARGNMEYDAEAAQAAANSILAVSQISQGPLWPEGTDNMSIDGTRALPSIWDDNADFVAKFVAFGERAQALADGAGNGVEALGPLLGGVGGTCQACHEAHREPDS